MGRLLDEDAVIKVLECWRKAFRENSHYVSASDLSLVVKDVRELPSAQPEPKEGHWIDKGWNGDWAWQIDGRGNCWRVIECSECGKSVLVESNYCPHCGARMKGSEHEID